MIKGRESMNQRSARHKFSDPFRVSDFSGSTFVSNTRFIGQSRSFLGWTSINFGK